MTQFPLLSASPEPLPAKPLNFAGLWYVQMPEAAAGTHLDQHGNTVTLI